MVDNSNVEGSSDSTRIVLVVDDHELVRNLVVSMLLKEGFGVLSASSGSEAIELVRAHTNIRCVLQDLSMPKMSGEETISRLSDIRPNLPILVYSADEESVVAHKLAPLSIVGYLQKPFDPGVLIDKLRTIVGNELTEEPPTEVG